MSVKKARLAIFSSFIIAALMLASIPAPAMAAGTCYVKPGASGAGSSWVDAYGNLQSALGDTCTEIWVAAGTYKPTSGTDRTATFQLKSGVAVYGGFAGTETARDQRNPATNLTTLSGDLNGDDNSNVVRNEPTRADNSYHVVSGINSATLDGFTITAGNANGTAPHDSGGGMYNDGSNHGSNSPTLANIIFSANSARDGGGMYNDGSNYGESSPTLTNVTFSGNSAGIGGGMSDNGYDSGKSSPTLTRVTFSGNSASAVGGGMYNIATEWLAESSPNLTEVTFSGNSADTGGGMYNHGFKYGESNPTLTNVTFSENSAAYGGGMANSCSEAATCTRTLLNVTFSKNSAIYSGGGVKHDGTRVHRSTLSLTNVTFSENSAYIGGGMTNQASGFGTETDLSLNHVTFSGNSAINGGGMYTSTHEALIRPMLVSVTFSENSATDNGGGMYNHVFDGTISPKLTEVTFSGNSADGDGGGMYTYVYFSSESNPSLTNVTFNGNSARNGGGMYSQVIDDSYFSAGVSKPDLVNVTFSNNSATSNGGGAFFIGSEGGVIYPQLTNVTFSNNSARVNGGGVYNWVGNGIGPTDFVGRPPLTNVTFSGNSANSKGAGIFFGGDGGGVVQGVIHPILTNVIIANSGNGGDCWGDGLYPSSANNLIEDSSSACGLTNGTNGNIVGSSPNLSPLANNGGETQTFALLPGSPAIDAGTDIGAPSTDQRGVARPQGAGYDIGAYEAGHFNVITTTPTTGARLTTLSIIEVTFSEDALHDSSAKAADYISNYILVEAGANGSFNTQSCAGGVVSDDVEQNIVSAAYVNNSTTLSLETPLADGEYRLFICGTTSIWSAAGLELNDGLSDTTTDFTIGSAPASLPDTGFRHGEVTQLTVQPPAKAYAATAMTLKIPKLGVSMPIVGVQQSDASWDVTWLGNSAGYLYGSAFPTWAGNTVITGHVWDAYNRPGPFAELKSLKYGDQVEVHAWGATYTYEVRESKLVTQKNTNVVFQSEQYDWLTLVTCEFYNPFSGEYLFRRAVRAVLVSVK